MPSGGLSFPALPWPQTRPKTLTSLALVRCQCQCQCLCQIANVPLLYSQCCTVPHTQAGVQKVRAQPSIDDFILRSLYLCPVFLPVWPACPCLRELGTVEGGKYRPLFKQRPSRSGRHRLYNCALPIPTSRELPRGFIIITNKNNLTTKQPQLSTQSNNSISLSYQQQHQIIHHVFHRQQGQGRSPPRQVSGD